MPQPLRYSSSTFIKRNNSGGASADDETRAVQDTRNDNGAAPGDSDGHGAAPMESPWRAVHTNARILEYDPVETPAQNPQKSMTRKKKGTHNNEGCGKIEADHTTDSRFPEHPSPKNDPNRAQLPNIRTRNCQGEGRELARRLRMGSKTNGLYGGGGFDEAESPVTAARSADLPHRGETRPGENQPTSVFSSPRPATWTLATVLVAPKHHL